MIHLAALLMGIAIGDFAYVDTSGEASDQVAVHAEQLKGFMATLRRDFERQGSYRLVPLPCGTSCMDVELTELARMAAATGANIVVIGGIHKMSTLVQWARVEVIDVAANRVVFDRLFTFRGDNPQAWDRAEAFVFREVQEGLAAGGG
jgi:predicted metal-dependent phosphotriesterase family hydrolase